MLIIILFVMFFVGCFIVSWSVEKRDAKEKQEKMKWEQERLALLSMNYKQIAEKETIASFEEEIAYRLDILSDRSNENKYRDLKGMHYDIYARKWDWRKNTLERLKMHLEQHAELNRDINIAFQHFACKRWEECHTNLRKAIRWMTLIKIDADGILFAGEEMPKIVDLIDKYCSDISVKAMKEIYLKGNDATHAFSPNYYCLDQDSCISAFGDMENIIVSLFSNHNVKQYFEIELDVKKYLHAFEEMIANEYYDDAAVNLRKTLELIVKKYFRKYKIRCLCGYPKELSGYIDLLHEKQYISEESKTNMHEIRCITNDGAHEENQNYRLTKEKVIRCYEMIKKEIEILENIN